MMMNFIRTTLGRDLTANEIMNLPTSHEEMLQRQLAKQRAQMLLKSRMMKYGNLEQKH